MFCQEKCVCFNNSLYLYTRIRLRALSKTSLVKKAFAIISRLAKSVGNSFGNNKHGNNM